MKTETYTAIDYEELNSLISELFGWDESYDIVADLIEDNRWGNDTQHAFSIEENNECDRDRMFLDVADIAADGQIQYNHRVCSVLRQLMLNGKIPWGNVLVEICW